MFIQSYKNRINFCFIILFLQLQHVSVMGPAWPTACAVQMVSVFVSPIMGDGSVMNVRQATMDILTVLVSRICPSMSISITTVDKPLVYF